MCNLTFLQLLECGGIIWTHRLDKVDRVALSKKKGMPQIRQYVEHALRHLIGSDTEKKLPFDWLECNVLFTLRMMDEQNRKTVCTLLRNLLKEDTDRPGKFESSNAYMPYYYNLCNMGMGDSEELKKGVYVNGISIEEVERLIFPEIHKNKKKIFFFETNAGFVVECNYEGIVTEAA